jgi:hypothetical protein
VNEWNQLDLNHGLNQGFSSYYSWNTNPYSGLLNSIKDGLRDRDEVADDVWSEKIEPRLSEMMLEG